jgi:hypothetical protein
MEMEEGYYYNKMDKNMDCIHSHIHSHYTLYKNMDCDDSNLT